MQVICNNCDKSFEKRKDQVEKSEHHYCSRSCAAISNNKKYPKRKPALIKNCLICGTKCRNNYCSAECHQYDRYISYITRWKKGEVSGAVGKQKAPSAHVYRYMFEKSNNKCSECGWDTKHTVTGRVPLQLHHIDGDFLNNSEENLQVLCPNCHSLTTNFGTLNKKTGRRKHGCM